MTTEDQTCGCVRRHQPAPYRYGRVQIGDDVYYLCPSQFTAFCDCVEEMKMRNKKLVYRQLTKYPTYARNLALRYWHQTGGL